MIEKQIFFCLTFTFIHLLLVIQQQFDAKDPTVARYSMSIAKNDTGPPEEL